MTQRHWESDTHWNYLDSFTTPACDISGLKSAHIHSCKQYIWWSYNKSAFNAAHFNSNPFTSSYEGDKNAWLVSNLALTSDGRFPSDIAVNMAVKGLMNTDRNRRKNTCWETLCCVALVAVWWITVEECVSSVLDEWNVRTGTGILWTVGVACVCYSVIVRIM